MTGFEEIYYATDDGLKLYVREYPGPGPDAPVVLCLHGLTRNSRDFHALAQSLTAHFRVLVPEQRGRGRSEYDHDPAATRSCSMCWICVACSTNLGLSPSRLLVRQWAA